MVVTEIEEQAVPQEVNVETKTLAEPEKADNAKDVNKKRIVFVMGAPGSGKGTQCINVIRRMRGWATISAGDVLRKHRRDHPESEEAKIILEKQEKGENVPAEVTLNLLLQRMNVSKKTKWLIDGFPRVVSNLEEWEKQIGDSMEVLGVLHYDADWDEAMNRILARAVKSSKKKGEDGEEVEEEKKEETEAEKQESEASLKRRMDADKEATLPVISLFESRGQVYRVDASQNLQTVWKLTQEKIREIESKLPRFKKPEKADAVKKELEWSNIGDIDPNMARLNVYGKVTEVRDHPSRETLSEVVIGDESGVVTCSLKKSLVEKKFQVDTIVQLKKTALRMTKNYIRLEVDKWTYVKVMNTPKEGENADDVEKYEIGTVNKEKDVSATEYEAIEESETDKPKKGEGKKRSRGGKKGKGKRGKRSEKKSDDDEEETEEPAKTTRKGKGKGKAKKEKKSEKEEATEEKADDKADDKAEKPSRRKGKGKRSRKGKGKKSESTEE